MGVWKAAEWKQFVLSLRLVAFHEWMPRRLLEGWSLYVQLCDYLKEWRLTRANVLKVETLAQKFYKHYADVYFACRPERIHLCRYIHHLLLHLADCVRDCGPVSMLAQWTMETFVGSMNRRCHASFLFAESVAANIKLESATRLYCTTNSFEVPYISTEQDEMSDALSLRSNQEQFEAYTFKHPRRETTVSQAESQLSENIGALLRRYYRSTLSLNVQETNELISADTKIVLWKRMAQTMPSNIRTVYRIKSGVENSFVVTRAT